MATTKSFFLGSGTIASATAVVGPFDVSGSNTACVGFNGTYGAATVNFEGSIDGVVWFGVLACQTSAASSTASPGLAANSTIAYEMAVGPFMWLRVRTSALASGTINVQASAGDANFDPTPAVGGTVNIIPAPSTSSGSYSTFFHLVSAATTNATNVKATAGNVGHLNIFNGSAAVKYVKLFNLSTTPVVGTSTPVKNLGVPANTNLDIDYGLGLRFSAGIAFAITGGQADLDATAVAAGDVMINISYI